MGDRSMKGYSFVCRSMVAARRKTAKNKAKVLPPAAGSPAEREPFPAARHKVNREELCKLTRHGVFYSAYCVHKSAAPGAGHPAN